MMFQMVRFHYFFILLSYIYGYTYTHIKYTYSLLIHLLMDTGCLRILATVNNAAMNIGMCISFQISVFIFFRQMFKGRIARSHGSSIFKFYLQNVFHSKWIRISVQFSSVAQSCPTLCDPMNRSTPGLPVHHQLLEFTQTHVHRVSDAIQPSHPLLSPSPPALNQFTFPLTVHRHSLFSKS